MSIVLKNRVRSNTTTTGTGTVTLDSGTITGYRNFSVIGNSNQTYYIIKSITEWEVGKGTYTSSGTTLSRDVVFSSSNGGNKVDFGAGTKDVFVIYPNSVASGSVPSFDNNEIGTDLSGWRAFQGLLEQSVAGGVAFNNGGVNGIISTYDWPSFASGGRRRGGVLALDGSIHLIPYNNGSSGRKLLSNGIIVTYAVTTGADLAFDGGALMPNGDIHFVPDFAGFGQKVSANGVVTTYTLVAAAPNHFYRGAVVAPNGDLHFVPADSFGSPTVVGQKVSSTGVVSTYSLVYTGTDSTSDIYAGGVLAPNGDIHFVPHGADRGQKISAAGVVSTYSLIYTTASGAYTGGVLAPNGDIHFVPFAANRGQKVSASGVVSTYSLVYTTTSGIASGAYQGGVLAPNGDIHFVPSYASVGQKVSASGVVSTYSLVYTTQGAYYGGVLTPNGEIHFIPSGIGSQVPPGQKISTLSGTPLPMNACLSPFLNKL